MLISHKYKFIFIKTRKTAGTRVEVFLSGQCGENNILTPIEPPIEGHRVRHREGFYNHMPAEAIKEKVGDEIWSSNYKFCIDDSRVLVDQILRYEDLSEELSKVFKKLNIPFSGTLGVNSKSEYRQDRRNYSEVLTTEQANQIERKSIEKLLYRDINTEPR